MSDKGSGPARALLCASASDTARWGLALREREGGVVFGGVGDVDDELFVDCLLDLVRDAELSRLLDGGGRFDRERGVGVTAQRHLKCGPGAGNGAGFSESFFEGGKEVQS